jgi:hypothetical protein
MSRLSIAAFLVVLSGLCACRGSDAPRPLAAANEDVKSVLITHGPASFSLLQELPGSWRVAPPGDSVDPADAAALLDGLRNLKPETRLADGDAAYGLAAPDATDVRAAGAGGKPLFSVRFGRRGPGGAVHMSGGDGAAVYLGTGPAPQLLARGADDWRDRRLLRAPCADVELDSGRGWRAASPAAAAALCGLRVTAILPSLPEFLAGLDRPVLRVRSASGAFAVGSRMGKERWVSIEGRTALFRVPAAPLAAAAVENPSHAERPSSGIIPK